MLGAAGAYFLNTNKGQDQTSSQTAEPQEDQNTSIAAGQTLIDLLQKNESQQCNFNYEDEESSTAGVIYIHNQRMRADITSLIDRVESGITLLRKEDINYVWGTPFPDKTGLVFEASVEDIEDKGQFQNYLDPEKQMDFSCSSWTVEESAFQTPDDIKFNDLSGIVGDIIEKEIQQ